MTDIKNQTDVLFHADLAEREFGSALLSVSSLTTWVKNKDLELVTVPPLAGYRFVQAEALLCAIERGANSLTPEQAAQIVRADPILSKHRAVTEPDGYIDPITSRWLLGADAHLSWRRLLENAIEQQELKLLNFASKLPIQAAPAQNTATPAPVGTENASDGDTQSIERIRYEMLASRTELIEALRFYGVELKIFRALNDRPGLRAARKVKGKGQRGSHAEPMFCPLEVVNWLVTKGVQGKPKLTSFQGWHILETKFPSVYAENSIGDPRHN